MSTRQLPANVTTHVRAAGALVDYATLNSREISLIDPKDRRVAEIIMWSDTTGAAPPAISLAPTSGVGTISALEVSACRYSPSGFWGAFLDKCI
jgi:hypothetical protein